MRVACSESLVPPRLTLRSLLERRLRFEPLHLPVGGRPELHLRQHVDLGALVRRLDHAAILLRHGRLHLSAKRKDLVFAWSSFGIPDCSSSPNASASSPSRRPQRDGYL